MVKKEKYVPICPKCCSTDVSTDFSNPALVGTGLINSARVCNNCGHSANFFPEARSDKLPAVKKVAKEDNRELVNTTYGKNINWIWRITGPLGIFLSLILLLFYNVKLSFYIGLVMLLPLSCMITLASYRNDLIKKYPVLRVISVIIYFYSITIAPIIAMYLADYL